MVPLLYLKNLLIAVNEIDVNNFTSSDVPGNGLGLLICALATVWPYVQKKKLALCCLLVRPTRFLKCLVGSTLLLKNNGGK